MLSIARSAVLKSSMSSAAASMVTAGLFLTTPAMAQRPLIAQRSEHLARAMKNVLAIDRVAPTAPMRLQIALPIHNQAALQNFLIDIYDPASPNYHRFLKTGEFARLYGPTAEEYQAAIDFAQSHGLTVTQTYANRTVLDVAGPASAVSSAFHVNEVVYQRPDGTTFYAPDRAPTVDNAVRAPILAVGGLDDAEPPHRNFRFQPSLFLPLANAGVLASTGIGGYSPSDFKTAYGLPSNLNGSGVVLGVFQNTGYLASDITTFENQYGLRQVPLVNRYLDGKNSGNQGLSGETTLDIEMQVAIAPGASQLICYIGGSGLDIATAIASDNTVDVCSCSLGYNDGTQSAEGQEYMQMAAQGQSYFVASGDGGAWTATNAGGENPADQPYVTSVGGTHLNTNTNGSYASESAWVGSGGGISPTWAIPWYQQGLSMSSNGGSASMRNAPDVAFCADTSPGISFYFNGGWGANTGGTSFAAPLWAGITALVDQQRASNGLGPIGFLNPSLYSLGRHGNYSADFHDITTGNNNTGHGKSYSAVSGYDLATGWGTPQAANLIHDLSGIKPGIYEVVSVLSGLALDGAANTQGTKPWLYGLNNSVDQQWSIQPIGSGYSIVSVQSGLALDGAANTFESNPWMYGVNNSVDQQWMIQPSGSGYSIVSVQSGLALDGAANTQGTNPWMYTVNNTPDQQWRLVPIATGD